MGVVELTSITKRIHRRMTTNSIHPLPIEGDRNYGVSALQSQMRIVQRLIACRIEPRDFFKVYSYLVKSTVNPEDSGLAYWGRMLDDSFDGMINSLKEQCYKTFRSLLQNPAYLFPKGVVVYENPFIYPSENVRELWEQLRLSNSSPTPINNGDFFNLWGILADAYGDENYQDEHEACSWISKKGRYPTFQIASGLRVTSGWYWYLDAPEKFTQGGNIPEPMHLAMAELNYQRWLTVGASHLREAYEFIIQAWNKLNEDERNQCWEWEDETTGSNK